VFVTGTSLSRGTGYDYATVAYNATSGRLLWARRYNGPANGADGACSVAVSPQGATVFVTGTSPGRRTGNDYATVAPRPAARRLDRRQAPPSPGPGAHAPTTGSGSRGHWRS